MTADNTKNTTGIVVVDIQGDFTAWKTGALAIEGTDREYVEEVEACTRAFAGRGLPVFATQDWHPEGHVSFYTSHPGKAAFDIIDINGVQQVLWPPHCVQGTENAELLLDPALFRAIIRKGMNPGYDSYSGFQDDGGLKTSMDDTLRKQEIGHIVLFGLATDYCVNFTAKDAVDAGYRVTVVENLCRGVQPDTTKTALEEMKKAGIRVVSTVADVLL